MLKNIPTHLIAGPLGAGKTSLIQHLLAQKPAGEHWAVLINEFGQIGLDAALLSTDAKGISLAEVAGGCLCCVNGLPFQVGLTRLLRKAQPDRLLIEPSGLGHPAQLLRQLRQPPWQGVLALQPSVLVLDAAALAGGTPVPDSQQPALENAGLLLLNKSSQLDQAARRKLLAALPPRSSYWTEQGALPLDQLPGIQAQASGGGLTHPLADFPSPAIGDIWLDPRQPICRSQNTEQGWSIGWRWHPSQRFAALGIQTWLASLPWSRAKGVLHSDNGWLSGNAVDRAGFDFKPSEWRKDSRLELIFSSPQDAAALTAHFTACRIA